MRIPCATPLDATSNSVALTFLLSSFAITCLHTRGLKLQMSPTSPQKVACYREMMTTLHVRKPITAASAPDGHNSRRSRSYFYDPVRIYVPLLARPWIVHACHADASCHLGVTRTLKMLERFYWWVGMEVCTKWWVRRCLICRARKISRQTIPWPTSPFLCPIAPEYPSVLTVLGLCRSQLEEILAFFSSRTVSASGRICSFTSAEFTAESTANILVNHFTPLWGCPSTLSIRQWTPVLRTACDRRLQTSGYTQAHDKRLPPERERRRRTCKPHHGANASHGLQRTPKRLGCTPSPRQRRL